MSRFTLLGCGGGSYSYLLSTLSVQPVAAYSVRHLRQAYSGACLRVRRDSDNTEEDINFKDEYVDTGELLSFCGAGSGYLSKIYDQVGSSDLSNTTAANQPRIVSSGVVETVTNGKAAPNFLTSAGAVLNAAAGVYLINGGAYTVVGVVQLRAAAGPAQGRYFAGHNRTGAGTLDNVGQFGHRDDSNVTIAHWSDDQNFTLTSDTTIHRHLCVYSDPGSTYYLDGTSLGTGVSPLLDLTSADPFSMGAAYYSTFFGKQTTIDGWLPELLVFTSALGSGDRGLIGTSQSSYFGTA